MYRIWLFVGALACATLAFFAYWGTLIFLHVHQYAYVIITGVTLLIIGAMLAAGERQRHPWGIWLLHFAGAALTLRGLHFVTLVTQTQGSDMYKILLKVHFYTNLLIPAAYGAMLLSAFSLKKSDDASYLPAMWTAFAAAACLSAPILGYLRSGPITETAYFVYYALTITGLMLLLIATFLVSTEGKRDKFGIILLNIAASAFALTGALVLATVGFQSGNGGFGPQNLQTIGTIGGIVFLAGWGSLMLFALVAKGNGEDRIAFRTWLFICGLSSSAAIVLVEIFSLQPFQQSLLLPMTALALFVPALPLLITAALLAATDGRRSAFSSILFESAAVAFVAVSVIALLVIGAAAQHRGLEAPNMEPLAKAAILAFIAGLAALAAAPLGLKARE